MKREEIEKIIKETFPEGNLNYVNYEEGLDCVVIDGRFDLERLIERLSL